MTTTSVGPRLVVLEKIRDLLEEARDQCVPQATLSIRITYVHGVPKEDIRYSLEKTR